MADAPKIFTVDEANGMLEQVRPLLQQLQGLQASLLKTNQRLDEAVSRLAQGNGYPLDELKTQVTELTSHQLNLIEAFQSALAQLEQLGCVVKDISVGLVDFYALRDSELVFLCWRMDEDHVRFWHRVEDGFAGRQPV